MRKRILMVAAAITVMLSTFTGCANKEMVLTADNITISGKLEKEAKYVSLKDTDKEETEYQTSIDYLYLFNATYEIYDIDILNKKEEEIQPSGQLDVKLKLSDKLKNATGDKYVVFGVNDYRLFRINNEATDDTINFKINDIQKNDVKTYIICKYNSNDEQASSMFEGMVAE